MVPAVEATLDSLPLAKVDDAAARLARVYARALDDAAGLEDTAARSLAVSRIGPRLLDALESLGATPRARGLMTRGSQGGEAKPPAGRLASIRGSV